jgi:hypothetical protein
VLLSAIRNKTAGNLKFAEVRPLSLELGQGTGWTAQGRYHLHLLDLTPDLEELHSRLHKDGVQRKIRRAYRERVEVKQGRSELLLKDFYELMVSTRRRQVFRRNRWHGSEISSSAWGLD